MEKVIEDICDQHSLKIKEIDLDQKIEALKKELPEKFTEEVQNKLDTVKKLLEDAFQKNLEQKREQINSLDKIIEDAKKLAQNQEESKEISRETKIIQFGKSLEKIQGLQSQIQQWNQHNIKLSVIIDESKFKELLRTGCTILVESEDNKEILKIEPKDEEETKDLNDEEAIKSLQQEEINKRDDEDKRTESAALEREVSRAQSQNDLLKNENETLINKLQKLKSDYQTLQSSQASVSTQETQSAEQDYYITVDQGWTPWTNAPKPDLSRRDFEGVKWIGSWSHLYSTYAGFGPYSAMYQYKVRLSISVDEFKKKMQNMGHELNGIGKA